jgi:hypothetical protein
MRSCGVTADQFVKLLCELPVVAAAPVQGAQHVGLEERYEAGFEEVLGGLSTGVDHLLAQHPPAAVPVEVWITNTPAPADRR